MDINTIRKAREAIHQYNNPDQFRPIVPSLPYPNPIERFRPIPVRPRYPPVDRLPIKKRPLKGKGRRAYPDEEYSSSEDEMTGGNEVSILNQARDLLSDILNETNPIPPNQRYHYAQRLAKIVRHPEYDNVFSPDNHPDNFRLILQLLTNVPHSEQYLEETEGAGRRIGGRDIYRPRPPDDRATRPVEGEEEEEDLGNVIMADEADEWDEEMDRSMRALIGIINRLIIRVRLYSNRGMRIPRDVVTDVNRTAQEQYNNNEDVIENPNNPLMNEYVGLQNRLDDLLEEHGEQVGGLFIQPINKKSDYNYCCGGGFNNFVFSGLIPVYNH